MHLQSLSRVCLTGFLMLSIPQTLMAATGTIGRYLIPDTGPLVWQQAGTVDIATTFVAGYDGNSFLLRKRSGALYQWKISLTGTVTQRALSWSKGLESYPVVGYAQGRFLTWNNLDETLVRWNIDQSTSVITSQSIGRLNRSSFAIEGFDGNSLILRNLTNNNLSAWFLDQNTGAPYIKKYIGNFASGVRTVDYIANRLVSNSANSLRCWTITTTNPTITTSMGSFDPALWSEAGFDGTRLTLRKTSNALRQWIINPDYTITSVLRSSITPSCKTWSTHGGRVATGYAGTTLATLTGFETQQGSMIISGKVEDNALASVNVAVDLYRVTNGTAVKVAARKTNSGGRFEFQTAPLVALTEYEVRVAGTP